MTIGPEPIIRILSMSSRRGTPLCPGLFVGDLLHELVEQVARVAWPRTRLGVVLDAPRVERGAGEPFDRPIVEVAVGHLDSSGQGLLADSEAVVLAGNLDPPGPQVTNRVVCAMVPERHLVRLAPQRQAEELVTKADAEDRPLPENPTQVRDSLVQSCWVPGTI